MERAVVQRDVVPGEGGGLYGSARLERWALNQRVLSSNPGGLSGGGRRLSLLGVAGKPALQTGVPNILGEQTLRLPQVGIVEVVPKCRVE